jgi:tetratricopeptide (TPR) repeat protein
MKRSERHRLKENELATTVHRLRATIERNQRLLTGVLIGVTAVVVAVVGLYVWRVSVESRSNALLAEAMTVLNAEVVPEAVPATADAAVSPAAQPPGTFPTDEARLEAALPKLMAAAETGPSSKPGLAARYHAAAALAGIGRKAEAIEQYREVVRRGGRDELYGRMARLGLAGLLSAEGNHDEAIAIYGELLQGRDEQVPGDAVLMQLGRAYRAAGRSPEAHQTFQRVIDDYPLSPYSGLARRELESVRHAAAGTQAALERPARQ